MVKCTILHDFTRFLCIHVMLLICFLSSAVLLQAGIDHIHPVPPGSRSSHDRMIADLASLRPRQSLWGRHFVFSMTMIRGTTTSDRGFLCAYMSFFFGIHLRALQAFRPVTPGDVSRGVGW